MFLTPAEFAATEYKLDWLVPGVLVAECNVFPEFRLPKLGQSKEVQHLAGQIRRRGLKVIIIDPISLSLLAGNTHAKAPNLFDMGPLLADLTEACIEAGATRILVHHTVKHMAPAVNGMFEPIDREQQDLDQGGRRASKQPGTESPQMHRLLSVGQGLPVSKDKGLNWEVQVTAIPDKTACVGPYFGKDEKHIFVVGKEGVQETSDAGQTWKIVAPAQADCGKTVQAKLGQWTMPRLRSQARYLLHLVPRQSHVPLPALADSIRSIRLPWMAEEAVPADLSMACQCEAPPSSFLLTVTGPAVAHRDQRALPAEVAPVPFCAHSKTEWTKMLTRIRDSRLGGNRLLQSIPIRLWITTQGVSVLPMNEVTRILSAIDQGEPSAASQLLPLVYDELRKLAAQKLAQERAGQTLQPTALVHEAYLRLVKSPPEGSEQDRPWDSRGHFFAAAAEAMRRILVESARRKKRIKHGGDHQRVDLNDQDVPVRPPPEEILALDEALTKLADEDPDAAKVVQLHFFAGLSIDEAGDALGVSRATAYRHWTYARAWLRCAIADGPEW